MGNGGGLRPLRGARRGRVLEDWITAYRKWTKNTESPGLYHEWVALSMIASALKRQVHMNLGRLKIRPNLYVVLVGPAGCRKSQAIDFGIGLLKEGTTVRTTAESITREKLILDMSLAYESFEDNGVNIYQSAITTTSREFSVFLGVSNLPLLAFLCDIYDGTDPWIYSTKSGGDCQINGPCLNILAATTPNSFVEAVPELAKGSGLTSRLIIVMAHNREQNVPIPYTSEEDNILRGSLVNDIGAISMIRGELCMDQEAIDYWMTFYGDIETSKTCTLIGDQRFEYYLGRRATHLLKVAIIYTISEGAEFVGIKQLKRALASLQAAEKTMPDALAGFGRSKSSQSVALIEGIIKGMKDVGISETVLISRTLCDIDIREYSQVIMALRASRKVIVVQKNGVNYYFWNSDHKKELEK